MREGLPLLLRLHHSSFVGTEPTFRCCFENSKQKDMAEQISALHNLLRMYRNKGGEQTTCCSDVDGQSQGRANPEPEPPGADTLHICHVINCIAGYTDRP